MGTEVTRETIIIIPGARYLRSENPLAQGLISSAYSAFNVEPDNSTEEDLWICRLRNAGYTIVVCEWSGIMTPSSVTEASDRFLKLLRTTGARKIIACSIGAHIAVSAFRNEPGPPLVISLAGVYRRRQASVPHFDIRSDADRFSDVAQALINIFNLSGKDSTIIVPLPDMRHDEFHYDQTIVSGPFRGKRISDILKTYLKKTETKT